MADQENTGDFKSKLMKKIEELSDLGIEATNKNLGIKETGGQLWLDKNVIPVLNDADWKTLIEEMQKWHSGKGGPEMGSMDLITELPLLANIVHNAKAENALKDARRKLRGLFSKKIPEKWSFPKEYRYVIYCLFHIIIDGLKPPLGNAIEIIDTDGNTYTNCYFTYYDRGVVTVSSSNGEVKEKLHISKIESVLSKPSMSQALTPRTEEQSHTGAQLQALVPASIATETRQPQGSWLNALTTMFSLGETSKTEDESESAVFVLDILKNVLDTSNEIQMPASISKEEAREINKQIEGIRNQYQRAIELGKQSEQNLTAQIKELQERLKRSIERRTQLATKIIMSACSHVKDVNRKSIFQKNTGVRVASGRRHIVQEELKKAKEWFENVERFLSTDRIRKMFENVGSDAETLSLIKKAIQTLSQMMERTEQWVEINVRPEK